MLDRTIIQDVPTPPPSRPLVLAEFKIGVSPATGEAVGVDPDGHGVATGGSRTGKSSVIYGLLEQLIARGPDAPGIFLVDPAPVSGRQFSSSHRRSARRPAPGSHYAA